MGPRRQKKRKINREEAYEEEFNEEFELTGYEKAVNSRLNTGNRHWSNLLCMPDKSALNVNYKKVMEEGENLVNEYAWAIPSRRALGVIRSVASKSNGLVEVGAGTGYWAAELAAMGVNVNAYDKYVEPDTLWHPVKRGGPEVLRHKANRGRTLLLCYPDEGSSLAIACLDALGSDVDHIIHVGELITTGTFMSSEQRPFGRTSAAEFQVALMERFHCVLQMQLPRYPHSRDALSVWKRTRFVQATHDSHSVYAAIPSDERLPLDIAAPKYTHLLGTAPDGGHKKSNDSAN